MKKIALILFVLGIACFGLYFVMGSKFGDVKVVFNSNGGTTISDQVVKSGEKVVEPTAPTKDNSDFVEWQLNGQKYNFDSAVNSNITLNAVWNDYVMHTVKMSLESNEYTSQVRDGEQVSIDGFGVPEKEGYRIALYLETGEAYDMTQSVNSDLSLNGKYVQIKKYKVSFDSAGGSKVANAEVIEGNTVEEPTTTRDGYEFSGWYLSNEKFDFSTPISKSITLKAKWTEKGKVNVIFMADDKVFKTTPVKEGTKVSKPSTNPTKKGYKFVEWDLDGEKFDFNTKIESETTLIAKFEEVSAYTVKFNSDGGSKVDSVEVEAGSKLKKPSTNPTKDGYKFVEWQLDGKAYDFNKTVEKDFELKALWKRVFTVKFVSDNSDIDSQKVAEGEKAKSVSIDKNGYKFEGWLLDNEVFDFNTPITKDITLTAAWSRIEANNEQQNPDVADNNSEGNE